jgi:hypothetical protein
MIQSAIASAPHEIDWMGLLSRAYVLRGAALLDLSQESEALLNYQA